jgi:hypothetical protein
MTLTTSTGIKIRVPEEYAFGGHSQDVMYVSYHQSCGFVYEHALQCQVHV